jgi:hypothetical protein
MFHLRKFDDESLVIGKVVVVSMQAGKLSNQQACFCGTSETWTLERFVGSYWGPHWQRLPAVDCSDVKWFRKIQRQGLRYCCFTQLWRRSAMR